MAFSAWFNGGLTVRPGVARFDTQWAGSSSGPWPVAGMINVLNRAASPALERLSTARATACPTRSLWSRPAYGEDRTGAAALMADLIGLASRVPCWQLTLCEELAGLAATADLLKSVAPR